MELTRKDGVLLVYKERGWTSRDVCNKIQNIFNTSSVGHTGTLDPFAEGLLLVSINKANKVTQFTSHHKKTYIASLALGKRTSTGDLTSDVIEEKDVPYLDKDIIEEALNSFLGKSKQIPPMTSAIHYQGRKLYELAHEGEEVERQPRDIEIYSISLIDFKDNVITYEVSVSSGTYIRVLGEDIAKKLSTVGHLIELTRTKIDDYDLKDALKIGEITKESQLISVSDFLTHIYHYQIEDDMVKKVKDGMTLCFSDAPSDRILIIDKNNNALAIYDKVNERGYYRCFRGLW